MEMKRKTQDRNLKTPFLSCAVSLNLETLKRTQVKRQNLSRRELLLLELEVLKAALFVPQRDNVWYRTYRSGGGLFVQLSPSVVFGMRHRNLGTEKLSKRSDPNVRDVGGGGRK